MLVGVRIFVVEALDRFIFAVRGEWRIQTSRTMVRISIDVAPCTTWRFIRHEISESNLWSFLTLALHTFPQSLSTQNIKHLCTYMIDDRYILLLALNT